MSEDRERLLAILPKNSHKHIDAILQYFGDRELFWCVEIPGSRAAVETVEAYGLTIRLDATGCAVSVDSADGFEIVE